MDALEIERLIIELLAEERGCSVAEMERQLLASGADMPVDSLLAVEVLVRVEQRVGARFPASPSSGKALRSVRAFAQAMAEAAALGSPGRPAVGGQPA